MAYVARAGGPDEGIDGGGRGGDGEGEEKHKNRSQRGSRPTKETEQFYLCSLVDPELSEAGQKRLRGAGH